MSGCPAQGSSITDALRLMLEPEPGESTDPDREPLELPLVSSGAGARAPSASAGHRGRQPLRPNARKRFRRDDALASLIAAAAVVVAVVLALIGEALSFGDGADLAALVIGMLVVSLIDRFWAADLRRTRSPR